MLKDLSGAQLVKHDPYSGLTLVWWGGDGITGFNLHGDEATYWTMGADNPTRSDAEASIDRKIMEQYWP